MTNTVQDKVKTDWEKAQKEGGQRFDRIREIVKSAAAEALSELKDGSSEIESLGRQSLAEMLAELHAQDATGKAEGETIVLEQLMETEAEAAAASEAETGTAASPPTWREILAEALKLASDRKSDWTRQGLAHLQQQLEAFDGEMSQTYGLRYRPVQPLVRGLRSLVALAYNRVAQPGPSTQAEPIAIEVLDDTEPPVDDSAKVEG